MVYDHCHATPLVSLLRFHSFVLMYHARCSRTLPLDISTLRCDTSLRYLPHTSHVIYCLLQCHQLISVSSSPFPEGRDESANLDVMYPRRVQRDPTWYAVHDTSKTNSVEWSDWSFYKCSAFSHLYTVRQSASKPTSTRAQ